MIYTEMQASLAEIWYHLVKSGRYARIERKRMKKIPIFKGDTIETSVSYCSSKAGDPVIFYIHILYGNEVC